MGLARLLSISLVSAVWCGAVPAVSAQVSDRDAAPGLALLVDKGCTGCHSTDGTRRVGPSLLGLFGSERSSSDGSTGAATVDAAFLVRAIRAPSDDIAPGYPAGVMPTPSLSDAELDAMMLALEYLGGAGVVRERRKSERSILNLLVAMLLFVGGHLGLSSGPIRRPLVATMGVKIFQSVYSAIAILAMTWLSFAWTTAPYVELWSPYPWTRYIPLLGMPVVFLFMVVGFTTKGPTTAGMEHLLEGDDPARGIVRITRHPALCSFALWGCLHLPPNGDLASLILFGGIITLAVAGIFHIEARRRATFGDRWERFASKTSIVPFVAIMRGRNHLAMSEVGFWRIAGAILLYVAMLYGHQQMIGVSPLPMS